MENEYREYETFILEVNGKETEFAIEEEFEAAGKTYVVAARVEDDEIVDDGSYIFVSTLQDGEAVIEKITDAKEYEKVTEEYLKRQ